MEYFNTAASPIIDIFTKHTNTNTSQHQTRPIWTPSSIYLKQHNPPPQPCIPQPSQFGPLLWPASSLLLPSQSTRMPPMLKSLPARHANGEGARKDKSASWTAQVAPARAPVSLVHKGIRKYRDAGYGTIMRNTTLEWRNQAVQAASQL